MANSSCRSGGDNNVAGFRAATHDRRAGYRAAAAADTNGRFDTGDQARSHLAEARRVLSEVTTMPQAAQLQGEARTQVSQLITNFNALITAQANWREKYASVEQNLNTLLGASGADTAVTGTTGTATTTTGTAGTSGSTTTTATSKAVTVDPAIKTKLEEFKRHLTAFEAAAGAAPSPSASSEMATPPASPTTSSTTSTTTTTTPTPTPEPPAATGYAVAAARDDSVDHTRDAAVSDGARNGARGG